MSVTKERVDCYYVTAKPGESSHWTTWAKFYLGDEAWALVVHSEYGCWGHHWHPERGNRTFREFLTTIHDEYLLRKLCKTRTHFNCAATVADVRKVSAEMIGESLDRENSLQEWTQEDDEDLSEYLESLAWDCERSADLFTERLLNHTPWLYSLASEGLAVMDCDPQCAEMIRLLWPPFVAELRRELADPSVWVGGKPS